jgi:hypothetical protein
MDELVRKEPDHDPATVGVDQRALPAPVVARLVVLETEVRDRVAERQEKTVAPVVVRAEECVRLGHHAIVPGLLLRGHLERRLAVREHVDRGAATLATAGAAPCDGRDRFPPARSMSVRSQTSRAHAARPSLATGSAVAQLQLAGSASCATKRAAPARARGIEQ